MLDFQSIAAIIFLIILTFFVYWKRKNLDTKQIMPHILYFSMYKTTWGIRLMDSVAYKSRKVIIIIGYLGILVGFLGMVLISYGLVNNIFVLFTKPEASPGVGLVLPVKAKGIFYVPFFYWIISIFVIAVVHEFSHGLVARANNLKVKSSGFAFVGSGFRSAGIVIILSSFYLKVISHNSIFDPTKFNFLDVSSPDFWLVIGIIFIIVSYIKTTFSLIGYIPIIPAAFVEPDEKALRKRPHKEQLSVFAAGPFSNIAVALLCALVLYFVLSPIANAIIEPNGVKIVDYIKSNQTFPAESAGIKIGEIIHQADKSPTPFLENLSKIIMGKKPGELISIQTDKSTYYLKLAKNPDNESHAYLGAYLEQSTKINEHARKSYGEFLPSSFVWLIGLFFILYVLNLGIGLFNLVPIGPLDGGRMLQVVSQRIFGKERGDKVWGYIGMFFLILILVNIVFGFVRA